MKYEAHTSHKTYWLDVLIRVNNDSRKAQIHTMLADRLLMMISVEVGRDELARMKTNN